MQRIGDRRCGLWTSRWTRGWIVSVTGQWIPRPAVGGRPSGTLVVSASGKSGGTPTLGARLRTALARTSRTLYGERAPMVDALILGRRGGIDRGLQDRFAQSGLVHLFSISGFHVGVITAWVFLLCRATPEQGRALAWRPAPASATWRSWAGRLRPRGRPHSRCFWR